MMSADSSVASYRGSLAESLSMIASAEGCAPSRSKWSTPMRDQRETLPSPSLPAAVARQMTRALRPSSPRLSIRKRSTGSITCKYSPEPSRAIIPFIIGHL